MREVILMALLLLTPAQNNSASFEDVAKRAASAREANSLNEAIELYQHAVKIRPAWAEGWWYLGTLFYELDRHAEGRDAFRRLVALEPKQGPAWALLGLCEYRLREYAQAFESIERARSLGLGDNQQLVYVTRYHAGLLRTRFEHFEAAFALFFALAREHSDNPTIVEGLGLSLLRMAFLPSEVPPDKREMILMAGRAAAFTAARRLPDAQREYEQLVERYGDQPNVHYAYGIFLLQGQPDAALKEFRKELELSPSHVPARLQIAFEYLKRGEPAEGLTLAEEAVHLAPRSFAARNAFGRILLEVGRLDRAIKELELAAQLAPDSPETRFALARAYSRAGKKEEAERERAEFSRLNERRRAQREGPQAHGIRDESDSEKPPL